MRLTDKYHERIEASKPRCEYQCTGDWRARLHSELGAAVPCGETDELNALWPKVLSSLEIKRLKTGPESYLGWNDGDPALIEAIWCLIRHLRAVRHTRLGPLSFSLLPGSAPRPHPP